MLLLTHSSRACQQFTHMLLQSEPPLKSHPRWKSAHACVCVCTDINWGGCLQTNPVPFRAESQEPGVLHTRWLSGDKSLAWLQLPWAAAGCPFAVACWLWITVAWDWNSTATACPRVACAANVRTGALVIGSWPLWHLLTAGKEAGIPA